MRGVCLAVQCLKSTAQGGCYRVSIGAMSGREVTDSRGRLSLRFERTRHVDGECIVDAGDQRSPLR